MLSDRLLDKIVDIELDIADVSEFLNPSDIVETTFNWHELGLPSELVAFATDCSGNNPLLGRLVKSVLGCH